MECTSIGGDMMFYNSSMFSMFTKAVTSMPNTLGTIANTCPRTLKLTCPDKNFTNVPVGTMKIHAIFDQENGREQVMGRLKEKIETYCQAIRPELNHTKRWLRNIDIDALTNETLKTTLVKLLCIFTVGEDACTDHIKQQFKKDIKVRNETYELLRSFADIDESDDQECLNSMTTLDKIFLTA